MQSQTIMTSRTVLYIEFNKQSSLAFPHAHEKGAGPPVAFGLKKGKNNSSKICESVFPPYQEILAENKLISFLLFVWEAVRMTNI